MTVGQFPSLKAPSNVFVAYLSSAVDHARTMLRS